MSDSAETPGSSDESPPTPPSQSPPSNSPPTPPNGSSPPTAGLNPSPPESDATPPPPKGSSSSSSPPPDLKSPPSDSDVQPPSPPSGSASSPPSDSGRSPPTPPSSSGSSPPSPPSDSGSSPKISPPSNSGSSPPQNSSSPSPPGSPVALSPPAIPVQPSSPPSGAPPPSGNLSPPLHNSPPAAPLPAPAASNGSTSPPVSGSSGSPPPVQTVSPPLPEAPPGAIPSPNLPGVPPKTSTPNPTPSTEVAPPTLSTSTPPSSRTSNHVPKLSPPSKVDSSTPVQSSSSSKSNGSSASGSVVGVTVAGVLIIALVALFFVVSRRKRRRADIFTAQYRPTPNSFSVKSDGYYNRQQQTSPHTKGGSGRTDAYYGAKPPLSPSAIGNTYGSNQGNVYHPGATESSVIGGTKSWFSYEELMQITNGFSRQNVIGEGGFGCVYKGWLPDGRVVAVKQLKAGSGQGEREFRAEVEIISRVHHRHLVSLVGYCIAEHHRLLVYEFVPNDNLEHHLHGKGIPVMDWAKRVKIAIGSARGLAYLHEDCHPKIIHRDIKSANILVADFGLAKLSNDTHTHVSTRVMGTFGYMAPEYASSGKLTDRSDVFSFGVVLLELLTGRKPVDPTQPLGDESLVEWARPLLIQALETGDFTELADPRLEKSYVESEMFTMIEAAAACIRHSAPKRPRMVQVLRALDSKGEHSDLTNGVKVGQSTVFESGQYNSEILRFRRMAFGSEDSSEYDMNSGDYTSREMPRRSTSSWKPGDGSREFPSGESETRAMNPRVGERSSDNAYTNYGSRRLN
ncbi:hypothetical protein HHK36_015576 [Tetracentron sinense]|uniref:non-specific serine/threonine protein kinase n=1 Tax=Tetracentron sinense TaxID=13715 RepID=A0A835DE04_TETSI|nr:hypothetical protein HHK36_015576 [Tetracentron sinense]